MLEQARLLLFIFPVVACLIPLAQKISLDLRNNFKTELRDNDIFHGEASIVGEKKSTGDVIVLNAWRLDIFAVNVTCNRTSLEILKLTHQKLVDDTIRIEVGRNISKGEKCYIWIKYAAPFSSLYGLYKSYFPSKYTEGPKIVSITTNNEPEMNRLWAPCLDSMDILSNWTVLIDHPINTRVLGMGSVITRKRDTHLSTTITSIRPWQSPKVAFAIIEGKRFKTYSIPTKHNQTLRFWFPRNITFRMRANDILKTSSAYFNDLTDAFNHVLKCKNIEFVVLQHRSGLSSGCLVILDHLHDVNVQQLRSSIGKLWLGSEVLYSSTQDAWLTHSLAHYLAISYPTWTEVDRLKLFKETLEHRRILEEGLVSKHATTWSSRDLYNSKGAFVFSMLADVMTNSNFNHMMKELVRRFSGKFFPEDRLFFLVREFTEKSKWPACYRAFIGTQSDFIGLPVIAIKRDENNTLTISQHNFELQDRHDYRFRPWFFTSQWTNPLWISVNDSFKFMWLHHDDIEIQMELGRNESLFVDPEIRGLYLVEYDGNDLFELWNRTQECALFHRYCIEPSLNVDFCNDVYTIECHMPVFETIQLIYSGYKHRWDDDE